MSHVFSNNPSLVLLLSINLTLLDPAMCKAGEPASRTVTVYVMERCELSQAVTLRGYLREIAARFLDLRGYPVDDLAGIIKRIEREGFRNAWPGQYLGLPLKGEEVSGKYGSKKVVVKYKWIVVGIGDIKAGQEGTVETMIYNGPMEYFRFEAWKKGKKETLRVLGTPRASRLPIYHGGRWHESTTVDNTQYNTDAKLILLRKVADIYCDEGGEGQPKYVYKKRLYISHSSSLLYRRTEANNTQKQKGEKKIGDTGK